MVAFRVCSLLLLLATPLFVRGQEIKYVDLTVVEQRTALRHPPAPPPQCDEDGRCTSGGFGGSGVGDGAPDRRDPHALAVSLVSVGVTEIDPAQPFEAEFRVLNSGRAPIDIPVSPHLSDLQPPDESSPFTYFSLAVTITVEREPRESDRGSIGFVQLYGSPDRDGTMVTLKPGEWIRVKANVSLQLRPPISEPTSVLFRGGFWLRKNTFTPHPGGEFTDAQNLYPNTSPTEPLRVQLTPAPRSDDAKR
jgi:hypothetical protein